MPWYFLDCLRFLVNLVHETGHRIGQPALTQDSYFFHFITLKNNNFNWRTTNFAEVMCPIFTQDTLHAYLPIFDATATGCGLDYYWGFHETLRGTGVAILDATPMRHCRPVNSANPTAGLESPHQEFWNFMNANKISRYPHLCLGGVPDNGGEIATEAQRLALTTSGYNETLMKDPKYKDYVEKEMAELQKKHA